MVKKSLAALACLVWGLSTVGTAQADSSERFPYVAGSFYPKDPAVLTRMVDGFFEKAPDRAPAENPFMVLAPHAGYVYSGPAAAETYKSIHPGSVDTVILLGPCHRAAFSGASVWTRGSWTTPLGVVEIDTSTAEAIVKDHPEFQYTEAVHLTEHSLETQIPFLQRRLGTFKIVPILVDDASPSNCRSLARAIISATEGKKSLLVASSDLSHYHDQATARKMDSEALDLFSRGDSEGLRRTFASGETEMCGAAAVLTALEATRLVGAEGKILLQSDSASASGDTGRVVGYGSCVFYKTGKTPAPVGSETYTAEERAQMLAAAREAIAKKLGVASVEQPALSADPFALKRAVFVTLKRQGRLRGCIGGLYPSEPLGEAIPHMAVQAAFSDPRFPPLSANEWADVQIEISVLTVPERTTADEIQMGRDGVIVRKGMRSGVFLPQVADETGWSKETFLSELCSQKAGLSAEAWKDPATELYRFQVIHFSDS